jgi:DNA transformation protein and related proteins
MGVSASLGEFRQERLSPLGPVRIRKMFGGAGVYVGERMLGLLDGDVLYLKADDGNRPMFAAEGLDPFTYEVGDGRKTMMSYWRAPERVYDDPDEMLVWARAALLAAECSGSKAKPKRKSPAL